jgi:hypothetical protein
MTLKELIDRILILCPQAVFDEGPDNEVVIYTGHALPSTADWEGGHGTLEPIAERV